MSESATLQSALPTLNFSADRRHRLAQLVCVALGFVLILHATFRGIHSDLDAFAYSEWYDSFSRIDWQEFVDRASRGIYFDGHLPYRFEIGFALLAFASSAIGLSVEGFFLVCATASILPKLLVISRYSVTPLITLTWYVSWYYVLLEMNAIRAGIAAAILMLGVRHVVSGSLLRFAPFVAAACLFHVSAVSVILLVAARWLRSDARLILLIVVAAVPLSFFPIVSVLEPVALVSAKLQEYLSLLQQGEAFTSINVFNVLTLLRLVLLGALLRVMWRTELPAIEQIGIWALALSLAIYFFFASFPVVAGRLSEFVGIFQIFVAPVLFRGYVPAWLIGMGTGLLLFAQFWAVTFYSRLADFFLLHRH